MQITKKEIAKHIKGPSSIDVQSAQGAALRDERTPVRLLTVDEAHRARNPNTKLYKLLREYPAAKRMLLTATPVYNRPSDIAPLVNLVAQQDVLPTGSKFDLEYVQKPDDSLIRALLGGNTQPSLKNKKKLRAQLSKWVDYHEQSGGDFPRRTDTTVTVPMSKSQTQLHDLAWGKLPFTSRMRLKAGLPPSKQDLPRLNVFQSQTRQIGGSTKRFEKGDGTKITPKLQQALADLQGGKGNAVVYSNYLDTLGDYSKALGEAKIPHGVFTGKMSQKSRAQLVSDYNEGKIRALLLSSAGGEGLDLKNTRQVQVLEPHWNEEKLEQVIGRAIRHGSHGTLPEKEREVDVRRYIAHPRPGVIGGLLGRTPEGVEHVLANMAKNKKALNSQLLDLLRNKESTVEKTANQIADEALLKCGAVLSTARRDALPKKQFAVPDKEAYPIPDKAHARNALARVSQFGTSEEKAQVRAKVRAKYPEIGKK